MMSDNVINFKAAEESIQQSIHNGTQWKFIPKRAPLFGGWRERLIGMTKTIIKKILGRSCVTIDTLQTIATEIENTLKNR